MDVFGVGNGSLRLHPPVGVFGGGGIRGRVTPSSYQPFFFFPSPELRSLRYYLFTHAPSTPLPDRKSNSRWASNGARGEGFKHWAAKTDLPREREFRYRIELHCSASGRNDGL